MALSAAKLKRRQVFRSSLADQLHLIYIHIDPGTRELLYVGRSCNFDRPVAFYDRSPRHKDRLYALLGRGYTKAQIAHVVARGLTAEAAFRLEEAIIRELRPVLNVEFMEFRCLQAAGLAPISPNDGKPP